MNEEILVLLLKGRGGEKLGEWDWVWRVARGVEYWLAF